MQSTVFAPPRRRPARYVLALLGTAALLALVPPAWHSHTGAAVQVSFRRGVLNGVIEHPTSLAFGPDGRLYVASETAMQALTLDADGTGVTAVELVAAGLDNALGVAFDPTAPASPITVYASRQDPNATDGFRGTITRFTAPDWRREDVITGLPTSEPYLNHMTNGLAFDSQGRLFIAQGSASDTGLAAPGGLATYWPETPLSGALLIADIHATGFDGTITYDPAGPPSGDDIDQTDGDVQVFAPGLRNPYDFVLHSNGRMYATDNGPMSSETSLTCSQDGGGVSQDDELNLIEQGNYYGFPNRNRGRTDTRQCTYHAPTEGSGPDFAGPIAVLPAHCSCDGIVEYTSTAFGGELQGDLIIAEFIFGAIARVQLSGDGGSVTSVSTLASGFLNPLDVAVGPTGIIYIAQYTGNNIAYLSPQASTPTLGPSVTPTPQPSLTSTPPASTPTATPALVGDANCDGAVNSIDAALVLQLEASLIDELPCAAGDVNGDGRTDAIDAALILQYAAGLLPSLSPPD